MSLRHGQRVHFRGDPSDVGVVCVSPTESIVLWDRGVDPPLIDCDDVDIETGATEHGVLVAADEPDWTAEETAIRKQQFENALKRDARRHE